MATARACFAHFPQTLLVAEQFDGVARHRFDIAHIGEIATLAVIDDFGHAAGAGGNGNDFAGHRFQRRESE